MAESQVSVRAKTDACDIPHSRRVLPERDGTMLVAKENPHRKANTAPVVLQ